MTDDTSDLAPDAPGQRDDKPSCDGASGVEAVADVAAAGFQVLPVLPDATAAAVVGVNAAGEVVAEAANTPVGVAVEAPEVAAQAAGAAVEVVAAGCSGCSCSVVVALGVALSEGSAFAVHLIC